MKSTLLDNPLETLPRLDGIFYFVPKSKRLEFEQLGWWMFPALEGTYHGQFSLLGHWPCQCNMVVPL